MTSQGSDPLCPCTNRLHMAELSTTAPVIDKRVTGECGTDGPEKLKLLHKELELYCVYASPELSFE